MNNRTLILGLTLVLVLAYTSGVGLGQDVEAPDPMDRFHPYWEKFEAPPSPSKEVVPMWSRTRIPGEGWIVNPSKKSAFFVPDVEGKWMEK
jgi:hypothetical protein